MGQEGAVNRLLGEVNSLAVHISEGRLDERLDISVYEGLDREIREEINALINAVLLPYQFMAEKIRLISTGEIPDRIEEEFSGAFEDTRNNLNQCIDAINLLVSDAQMLARAAQEGDLKARADVSLHQGEFREIVEGLNNTLMAVAKPLQDAGRSLKRMTVNDYTARMDESGYAGEYRTFASDINKVLDWFGHITELVNQISAGDLSPLASLQKNGKRSDQDTLLPAFIRTFENLQGLMTDIQMLVDAALQGDFRVRADATKYQGAYLNVIEGINTLLKAMIPPIQEAIRVSDRYAQADFTARFDPAVHVAGEWTRLKDALDNIGIQICELVGLINKKVIELASNTEEATASVEEIAAGAQQVAKNVGKVSVNAEQGDSGLAQILKAMEDLTVTVSDVSQRAEKVSGSATEANQFSQEGIERAKKSESAMEGIRTSAAEVDQIIKDINAQMAEIGKIVRLITDISNQTNLLALNAAIEAARAGEAGRGFAVVAAEVKSLAQDSRASAENIADMIANLQAKAAKANDAMIAAGSAVEDGNIALEETVTAFTEIARSVEDITRYAMDMASASEEQAASVEEVTASVNEVSVLIQGTAKEAVDAAGATEETSASIDQIGEVMGNISSIAESISREMARFKV